MSKFSSRLKELRKESGLSQQKLADMLGITKSSINMYERGEREPRMDGLEQMSDFFDVDIDYLVGKSSVKKRGLDAGNDTAEQKMSFGDMSSDFSKKDSELIFALWGDTDEIDEKDLDDVKKFAAFIKERKSNK